MGTDEFEWAAHACYRIMHCSLPMQLCFWEGGRIKTPQSMCYRNNRVITASAQAYDSSLLGPSHQHSKLALHDLTMHASNAIVHLKSMKALIIAEG